MSSASDRESQFVVVVNGEEQYALWPHDRYPPAGWEVVHGPDSKSACLAYVEEVWTDITPLSVRRALSARPHGALTRESTCWPRNTDL
jgi:uncharacterized protein YbdZ (MbtH family)